MYTAHLDNSELTDPLFPYPYLQQNITHTVSIMLSKVVQILSINYPQYFHNPHINHNLQIITTIPISFHSSKVYTLPACLSKNYISRMVYTHLTQHVCPSNPFHGLASFSDPTVLTSSIIPLNLYQ